MNKIFLYQQLSEAKKELKDLRDMLKLNPQFKETTVVEYKKEISTLKKQIKKLETEVESI